jgi:hypothetical protein
VPHSWDYSSDKTICSPDATGQTAIIVHAGGEHGFVANALLMFKLIKKTKDYHQVINYSNYEKWPKEKKFCIYHQILLSLYTMLHITMFNLNLPPLQLQPKQRCRCGYCHEIFHSR